MDQLTRNLLTFLVASAAVAAVSMTATKSKIFAKPRKWVSTRSPFLGDLVSCPYCFSHWGSGIAVVLFQPVLVHSRWWLVDMLTTIFAMVTFASMFVYVIYWTYGERPTKVVIEADVLWALFSLWVYRLESKWYWSWIAPVKWRIAQLKRWLHRKELE